MSGDADHPGERRGDRAQPGEELDDQQRPPATPDEQVLGPADARVRLEGDATEESEDSTASAPAELVPDEVRWERRQEHGTERERQAHPPRAGERSDAEQNRRGGNR